jgi:hypothetical protein
MRGSRRLLLPRLPDPTPSNDPLYQHGMLLLKSQGPIIKAMGFSTLNAAFLDCAGRSLQVISLLIAGIVATKFKNCRIICVTVGNIVCVLGSALMSFLPFKQT